MPSALPDGEPAPPDGRLPAQALDRLCGQGFSVYVHVPFCLRRCGYCDFNTYTLGETSTAAPAAYLQAAHAEIDLASRVLGYAPAVDSVFFGGGTPTMLSSTDLAGLLDHINQRWGLAPAAEVTTEANPDTVDLAYLAQLADSGFTRVSLGMQSSVSRVLATLDRTHAQDRVSSAVAAAQQCGLAVSLDLIYGAPGESLADWEQSLETAIGLAPEHLSAYALVIEEGTRMAAQVRRGELSRPDDDDEATKYERADELLTAAGYRWYEISNWSRSGQECRHNLSYWRGSNWWGIGPGAHSHIGGVRWWNVKHPTAYAAALAADQSPAQGREVLTAEQRSEEGVLLGVRLAAGLDIATLDAAGRQAVAGLICDGLVDGPAALRQRLVLTRRGRLLADTVVRRLLGF